MSKQKIVAPKKPRGGQTVYTSAQADEIIARLSAGETLREICRLPGMPPASTVRGWVVDDRDGFGERYARARAMGIDAWADEMLEIAHDASNDWMSRNGRDGDPAYELNGEHVQRSRLRIDTLKWQMSKLRPEVYGDKHAHEHSGPGGKPIEHQVKVDRLAEVRAIIEESLAKIRAQKAAEGEAQ